MLVTAFNVTKNAIIWPHPEIFTLTLS